MDWLVLTFFSVISRSIYGVLTKVLSNKVKASIYTQSVALTLAGGVIAILISPLIGGLHISIAGASLATIGLVVFSQGVGNILYFEAMKSLTSGTSQIAFSSILIFNTLLSLIFLNLHLSAINVFGIILLMLAILSVTNGKVEFNKRGVSTMIFSAFLFSIFQLSSASLSKEVGAVTYLLIAYFGTTVVVFLLKPKVIISDLKNTRRRETLGIPFITAIPSLTYFTLAYYAYRNAPQPAKVAMLLTSQVVLTVFISYFFLREKDHLARKSGAAALVVLSAILIKQA